MTAQLVRGLSIEIKMGPSQLGAQEPPESLLSCLLSSVSLQGVSTCLHPFECWLQKGMDLPAVLCVFPAPEVVAGMW